MQSGGFIGRHLGPLLKTGLILTRNLLKSSAKSFSMSLGLTAAALTIDTGIHKKCLGLWPIQVC